MCVSIHKPLCVLTVNTHKHSNANMTGLSKLIGDCIISKCHRILICTPFKNFRIARMSGSVSAVNYVLTLHFATETQLPLDGNEIYDSVRILHLSYGTSALPIEKLFSLKEKFNLVIPIKMRHKKIRIEKRCG